jgi:hypothetical protein
MTAVDRRDVAARAGNGPGRGTADQVDVLARHVQRTCHDAVDALQIAAVLESDGLTDRAARDEYGHRDVFALAEAVFARLPKGPPPEPPSRRRPDRQGGVRVLSHGVLYALPSAVFPAVHALLGLRVLVTGLVFATALGWVWSMGSTVLAYRLLGWGHTTVAARVLRVGMLSGLAVGAAGAAALSWRHGLSTGLVALVVCQLGFQLAASILVFLHQERTLLLVMAPAVVLGIGQVLLGEAVLGHLLGYAVLPNPWTPRPPLVAWAAVAGVVAAVVAGYLATRPEARMRCLAVAVPPVSPPPPRLRRELPAVLPMVGYAGLCAGYLLFADARYLDSGVDAALAVTPLVLGMGAIEWQARRFGESAVALTRRCRYPAEFASGVWRLFGRSLGTVVGILVLLAATLLAGLGYAGQLTGRGMVLTAAHLFLGVSFFVGFVLINQGRLPVLLTVMGAALAGQVLPTVAGLPYRHGVVFLFTSAALLTALLGAVSTSLTQVRRYRW